MEHLPAQLTALLSNEYVIIALIAIGLYVTPNKLLAKLPVVGPVLQEFTEAWTRKQIENRLKTERLIEEKALRIVTVTEQLKRNGTLDSGSAKARAVMALRGAFTLSPERAHDFIEGAVYTLDSLPRPLETLSGFVSEYVPELDKSLN